MDICIAKVVLRFGRGHCGSSVIVLFFSEVR